MENATRIIGAFAARRLGDQDLFDRAVRGDAVAFSEVYRRYEKRVYGFCLARSLDPEAAADATQEVFMRLLGAAPGTVEHPRAWLFTVARNLAVDAIRKRVRLRESGEVDEGSPSWDAMAAADTADEVTSRAGARSVFLALRRMNPRYRTVLILREMHGQSSIDIAAAMAVRSVGAVDTLVSRARDAFGVAYAAVSELPKPCHDSVELMYRARGTGISAQERRALGAHLASCERCRSEEARADDPKRLSGLLPLLVPAGGAARSLLGRAALAGRSWSHRSATQSIARFLQTHVHTLGSRVAAGVLAATLVAAPVAAVTAIRHDPPPAIKASADVAMARRPAGVVGMSVSRMAGDGPLRARKGSVAMPSATESTSRRGTAPAHGSSMKGFVRGAKGSSMSSVPAKTPAARTMSSSGSSHAARM